jgi:four helix bundle protein
MSARVQSYRDLIVWQKAMALAKLVYQVSTSFPKQEQFGLTSQLRRSAISIPSNIAEGNGRSTTQDYIRFLQIARGSLFEAQTQIELSIELGFLTEDYAKQPLTLCNEIERMLNAIITKLAK